MIHSTPTSTSTSPFSNTHHSLLLPTSLPWLLLLGVVVCSATVAIGFAGYLNALFKADEIWTATLLVVAAAALVTSDALAYSHGSWGSAGRR